MQQCYHAQQCQTTIEEVERRLYALGGRKAKDDPLVRRMRRRYARPASDEEIYQMLDKVLGDRSIVDVLNEIR